MPDPPPVVPIPGVRSGAVPSGGPRLVRSTPTAIATKLSNPTADRTAVRIPRREGRPPSGGASAFPGLPVRDPSWDGGRLRDAMDLLRRFFRRSPRPGGATGPDLSPTGGGPDRRGLRKMSREEGKGPEEIPPHRRPLQRRARGLPLSGCLKVSRESCLHDIGEAHPGMPGAVSQALKHLTRQLHPRPGLHWGAGAGRHLDRLCPSKVGLQPGHGNVLGVHGEHGVPQPA